MLAVTGVFVERLQEIYEADAIAVCSSFLI